MAARLGEVIYWFGLGISIIASLCAAYFVFSATGPDRWVPVGFFLAIGAGFWLLTQGLLKMGFGWRYCACFYSEVLQCCYPYIT